jgi:hypothetical protein
MTASSTNPTQPNETVSGKTNQAQTFNANMAAIMLFNTDRRFTITE